MNFQGTFDLDRGTGADSVLSITNPVYAELVELGVIDPRSLSRISDWTRDLPIPVYLDEESRIIFLESCVTSDDYYAAKQGDRDNGRAVTRFADGDVVKNAVLDDDGRRFAQFGEKLAGKSVCDFGCGYGGFLERARYTAALACGVELRTHCRSRIAAEVPELSIAGDIRDHATAFDVVTLFHVLEHIPAQTAVLRRIRSCMKPGGEVIVEVPHARDFLIQSVDLPEFRDFTFWSEHLVLHTRESLEKVLAAAGFADIAVEGYQRYGYTNHFHWFLERKPGGHEAFKALEDSGLEAAYRAFITRQGATDTLIATAVNRP